MFICLGHCTCRKNPVARAEFWISSWWMQCSSYFGDAVEQLLHSIGVLSSWMYTASRLLAKLLSKSIPDMLICVALKPLRIKISKIFDQIGSDWIRQQRVKKAKKVWQSCTCRLHGIVGGYDTQPGMLQLKLRMHLGRGGTFPIGWETTLTSRNRNHPQTETEN